MAEILQYPTVLPAEYELQSRIDSLPLDARQRIALRLIIALAMENPPESRPTMESIASVIGPMAGPSKNAVARLPETSQAEAQIAADLLKLRKGINGPERVLAAGIKLYHEKKTVFNARTINITNDALRGAFISNITSAVASNIKDGFLVEAKSDGKAEGHGSYSVTPQGFAFFKILAERLGPMVEKQRTEEDDGDSDASVA